MANHVLDVAAGDSDVREHAVIQAAQLMEIPLDTSPARKLICEPSKSSTKP